jgi:hypothetical protein
MWAFATYGMTFTRPMTEAQRLDEAYRAGEDGRVVPHFEFSDWRCLINGMRDSIPPTAPAPTTPHEAGPQYLGAIQEARRSRRRAPRTPRIARVSKSEIHLPAL